MSVVGAEAPTVTMSFANNFWGKDDAGVAPLLERMHNAKVSNDEIRAFYSARAHIEEEYARKLIALAKKPLGSLESGSLRTSLDVVRGELDSMGKAHQSIAGQIKSELDEPLTAFAGAMKERRKIVQSGVEKLHKIKSQQTNVVNKTRDQYEQDCLRIKGYLAQGHMVMGQEERKVKAKLEKTQIKVSTSSMDYDAAVRVLEETTGRWNRDWKVACDKFQDLEEERIDFLKSSLWSFANITSTVCVTDDASCEKIRLTLEQCEVEKDITSFIREKGTGQEIPDPPKKLNFCREDGNDGQSEISEDEGYSVAQFQREGNPTYRTSSPNPSVQSRSMPPVEVAATKPALQLQTSPGRGSATPQNMTPTTGRQSELSFRGPPPPQNELPIQPSVQAIQAPRSQRQIEQNRPQQYQIEQNRPQQHQLEQNRQPHQLEYHPPTVETERGSVSPGGMYQLQQHHGEPPGYHAGAPSDISSARSPSRPVSRETVSDVSNPTSMSSVGDAIYGMQSRDPSPHKRLQKDTKPAAIEAAKPPRRKSGFFQGHSPFRRKSKHEKEEKQQDLVIQPPAWTPSAQRNTVSPEPVRPDASFQLNVGNNVFDVAHPDKVQNSPLPTQGKGDLENDPIAMALAELNGSKLSAPRISADRYTGTKSPAPGSRSEQSDGKSNGPPQYDTSIKRLDAPQPAFTSASMERTTRRYAEQTQNMFGNGQQQDRRNDGPQHTPGGTLRGRQSQHNLSNNGPGRSPNGQYRATSPNPHYGANRPRDHSQGPPRRMTDQPYSGQPHGQPSMRRSASPQPYSQSRSSQGHDMQLAISPSQEQEMFNHPPRGRPGPYNNRPGSFYGGQPGHDSRMEPHRGSHARSKSVADTRQYSRDGRAIMYYAKALYSYTAAIPSELSFVKGDVVAVMRVQDDGWWEGEVVGSPLRPGLVPSNYLQHLSE